MPLYVNIPPGGPDTRVLTAQATTLDFTGLNGDLFGDYEIAGYIAVTNSGSPSYYFRPNTLATNQIAELTANTNGTLTGTNLTTLFISGLAAAAGAYVNFNIRFSAKSGKQRFFVCNTFDHTGATNRSLVTIGAWTDTATNFTTGQIFCDTANGIDIGSRIVCRPLGVAT